MDHSSDAVMTEVESGAVDGWEPVGRFWTVVVNVDINQLLPFIAGVNVQVGQQVAHKGKQPQGEHEHENPEHLVRCSV